MTTDIVTSLLQQWASEHPDMETSALEVAVRIQALGKALQRRAGRALAVHGLKHWEYDVLSVLRRQGKPFEMAATDISNEAMLTTGAMTTRIDGLEKRGLLRRRKSPKDGRSVLVRLSLKGRRLIDNAVDTRLNDANEALASLDASERANLALMLRKLGSLLES